MKIAVIGAGYGGLSAAYDLTRGGHQVILYEANDIPGGLALGFKEPGWDWSVEAYYHHWFASDEHMLGLIGELGLSHKVIFPRPFTVLLYKGQWYPFDSIPQAILFPGLGWGINKVRFGLVGLYLRLTNNWRTLEKSTVDQIISGSQGVVSGTEHLRSITLEKLVQLADSILELIDSNIIPDLRRGVP